MAVIHKQKKIKGKYWTACGCLAEGKLYALQLTSRWMNVSCDDCNKLRPKNWYRPKHALWD